MVEINLLIVMNYPQLWNKLTENLRCTDTVHSFISGLLLKISWLFVLNRGSTVSFAIWCLHFIVISLFISSNCVCLRFLIKCVKPSFIWILMCTCTCLSSLSSLTINYFNYLIISAEIKHKMELNRPRAYTCGVWKVHIIFQLSIICMVCPALHLTISLR